MDATTSSKNVPNQVAILLLREGHAVPIHSLHPDELKTTRTDTVSMPGKTIKAQTRLNAICDCLGFQGDFGDYKSRHWPSIEKIMQDKGCTTQKNLFKSVSLNDFGFYLEWKKQNLAERIFESGKPLPKRAFLGGDFDWSKINDCKYKKRSMEIWKKGDEEFVPSDQDSAIEWFYNKRDDMLFLKNFRGDLLLDLDEPINIELDIYHTVKAEKNEIIKKEERVRKVAEVFRYIIDQSDEGWVDMIPITRNLVLLRAQDGAYEFLWKNIRTSPPPQVPIKDLHAEDTPFFIMDRDNRHYYKRGVWREQLAHEAETDFYQQGGMPVDYPGQDELLYQYIEKNGMFSQNSSGEYASQIKNKHWNYGAIPPDFKEIHMDSGNVLYVSDQITVQEFRDKADENEYWDRREGAAWEKANSRNCVNEFPVGVTYNDALAYCAWLEKEWGVTVRLMTTQEHRYLRPFESPHYESLKYLDFPWENRPPIYDIPSAIDWSESRFLDNYEEDETGISTKSYKRWIPNENWPPVADWTSSLTFKEYHDLKFIDAWDAYEWVTNGYPMIAGRYWEGSIGTSSWGEYKNAKVGFRVVIEIPSNH